MAKEMLKIYADTSVYGGVFDNEFRKPSARFFDAIRSGKFMLATSEVVHKELAEAPSEVFDLFREMLPLTEIIDISEEALRLSNSYQDAKILPPKWADDALHVALASVGGCNLIVSWNFKHIVHFQKIPLYNAVNTLHGVGEIQIHSPLEVVDYES